MTHWSHPFKGQRISLVPFTHKLASEAGRALKDKHSALGFTEIGGAKLEDLLEDEQESDATSEEDEFGHKKAPRGSGWLGRGSPLMARHGYKSRGLQDGGGLCSPGRWTPETRKLPENGYGELRKGLLDVVIGLGPDNRKRIFGALATGKIGTEDFKPLLGILEGAGKEVAKVWEKALFKKGRPQRAPLIGETLDWLLIEACLEKAGDPIPMESGASRRAFGSGSVTECLGLPRFGIGRRDGEYPVFRKTPSRRKRTTSRRRSTRRSSLQSSPPRRRQACS